MRCGRIAGLATALGLFRAKRRACVRKFDWICWLSLHLLLPRPLTPALSRRERGGRRFLLRDDCGLACRALEAGCRRCRTRDCEAEPCIARERGQVERSGGCPTGAVGPVI